MPYQPTLLSALSDRAAVFRQLAATLSAQNAEIAQIGGAVAALRKKGERAADRTVVAANNKPVVTPPVVLPTYKIKGLAVEGDSISTVTNGNSNPWPAQFATLTGLPVQNYAQSSTTLNQMKDNLGANDHAGPHFNADTCNCLILGSAGTNDLTQDSVSVDNLKSYVQTFCYRGKKEFGFQFVFVATITKRSLTDYGWNSTLDARRVEYNTWLKANAASFCDGVIDFDSLLTIDDMYDKLHPSNAAALKMATLVKSTVSNSTGTTTPVVTNSSITTNGVIDMDKWAAMAAKMWTLEGVAYRFGDPAPSLTNLPAYFKPGNHPWPENIVGTHSGTYQYGNFQTYEGAFQGGDFSSNIMWAPYVADDPANWIGLIELQANSTDHGTWAQEPELSWPRYGQGENAVEAVYWKVAKGYSVQKAICSANTLDRPGWGTQCITFFQDGSFVSSGANTMTNKMRGQLPAGLVPVACCVTGANGMCLVVCMDVPNKRGVLVPILLCGLGANSTLESPAQGDWWSEWVEPHPGLHNLGNLVFGKPLGVFPLPGMVAPTGISATTHHSRFGYLDGSPGEPSCRNQTFNDSGGETRRQEWMAGRSLERAYVKQAECIVISKVEQKALWIDLKPIYTYINSMYFGPDRSKYDETRNIGLNAGQWPYTFAERPQQMPTVTKTMTFDDQPTCVFMAPYSKREEWRQAGIGFRSGKVRIYNTGGVNDTGNAAAKVEAFSFDIGFNPTKMTWTKEKARSPSTQDGLVPEHTRHWQFCVRGEAAIKWVDLTSATTWKLRRVFQDYRLIDPVGLIDMDNHGAESYMTGVADCYGKGIVTIRWGDTIAWTYPDQRRFKLGADGTAQFEFCGKFPTRGYPFDLNGANVS